MTRRASGILARVRDAHGSEAGAVAIIVALLTPVLVMFAALAVDVGRWYVEAERIQKTADAAALAGVPYLPQDLPAAQAAALAVAAKNGYTPSSTVQITFPAVSRPSQLAVKITSEVKNTFATVFGFATQKVSRQATADYNGPAPMGSPCWSFGNEPDSLGQTRPSNCTNRPNFWATVHGPEVAKTQGDQFMTRSCSGGESGCSGSTNTEFDPNGYFFVVRVTDKTKVSGITVQLYDAAYVKTGFYCDNGSLPAANAYRPNGTAQNPYVNDARTRYAPGSSSNPGTYCTGDGDYSNSATTPTTTTFVLRSPVATQNPLQAPVIGSCQRQFFGWNDPASLSTILDGSRPVASSITDKTRYQPQIAETFHRWTTLCTIPGPIEQGDYYLQVRTNRPYGGSSAAWSSTGDNTSEDGQGANRFAIRAQVSGDPNYVSVASIQHMPIFANDPNNPAATFNLIKVLPGAAGKYIKFTFFDVGDAASGSATVQVKAPTEATGTGINPSTDTISTCTGTNWTNTTETLANCAKGGIVSSTWNGKSYTINVPIPINYTCSFSNATPSGCWYRVTVSFPPGTPLTDATTWTATLEGDPVRLVQ